MSQPFDPLDGLATSGLVQGVTLEGLQALLIGRAPDCLTDPATGPLVQAVVTGVAAEVAAITGREPAGELRDLAVWAVTLGAAANLEAALFPEGVGIGDTGRAEVLQRRYLGVLADLRRAATAGVAGGAFSGVVHLARGGWPG